MSFAKLIENSKPSRSDIDSVIIYLKELKGLKGKFETPTNI